MNTGFELEKMTSALRQAGMDAAVITSVPNLRYSTGIVLQAHLILPLRLMALVVPADGDPVLIACETMETLTSQAPDWLKDIRCYREFDKNAIQAVQEVLAEKKLLGSRIGIEKDYLVTRFWEQLRHDCPRATYLDVGPVMHELRMIKSPHEIDELRRAFVNTVEAVQETFESAEIGDTEAQVADRIHRGLVARGAKQVLFNIVVIEERTPWAHPPPGERALQPGELLRIDVGASFGLYCSDVGRTAAAVRWQPELQQAFEAVNQIRTEVIADLRPGMRIGDIYSQTMGAYPKFGLPAPPIHTLLIGHSLGIEVHEPPIIEPSTETTLTSGMVLNIEPHVLTNGWCMVHEDSYLVTEDGVELLAPLTTDTPLVICA